MCVGINSDEDGECPQCESQLVAAGGGYVAEEADDDDEEEPETAASIAPLETRSEWSVPPSARRWLVSGWLPEARIALLTGRGGSGKSQIALQLAHAIASDHASGTPREWFPGGPEIEGGQGAVVFTTWEDDDEEILRRMLNNPTLAKGAPQFSEDVGDRFHFVDLAGRGPVWAVGPTYGSYGELTDVGDALRKRCAELGARLLIVDALSSAYAANENERPAVRSFLSSWDRWARDTNCAVLLIAHPPKGDGTDNHYSGSTDWRNGVRSLLVLDRASGVKDRAKITCDKLNSAKTPTPISLGSPRWWEAITVDPEVIDVEDVEATEIRKRVIEALTTHTSLSKNKIRAAVKKAKAATFNIVDRMELNGELVMTKEGSAHLYSIASDVPNNTDAPF